LRTAASGIVVIVTMAASAAAQQKPQQYTERVEVARVLIDARVLDDRGAPVRDLQVDDFAVEIGGKPARLESVEWISGMPADDPVLDSAALDSHPNSTAGG
jgi:hypothetical protein